MYRDWNGGPFVSSASVGAPRIAQTSSCRQKRLLLNVRDRTGFGSFASEIYLMTSRTRTEDCPHVPAYCVSNTAPRVFIYLFEYAITNH